jgi:hypothetical protein
MENGTRFKFIVQQAELVTLPQKHGIEIVELHSCWFRLTTFGRLTFDDVLFE